MARFDRSRVKYAATVFLLRQISFRTQRDVKYDVENMGKVHPGRESLTLVILACGTGYCRCKRKEHTARSISCGSPAINPRFVSPARKPTARHGCSTVSSVCVFVWPFVQPGDTSRPSISQAGTPRFLLRARKRRLHREFYFFNARPSSRGSTGGNSSLTTQGWIPLRISRINIGPGNSSKVTAQFYCRKVLHDSA